MGNHGRVSMLNQWRQRVGFLRVCAVVSLGLFAGACSSLHSTYYQQYTLDGVHVVFLDETSLHEKWKEMSGENGTSFDLNGESGSGVTLQVVTGFFDPTTNTIYCKKGDFEVCGRELHHAVLASQSQRVVAQSQEN